MAEDNLGRKNRWEHVSPGEQSHITQFVAELELASSILPKEVSATHKSLIDLLYVGLRRDMDYSKLIQNYSSSPGAYRYNASGLFFRDVSDLKDRPLKAMLGTVEEGEVFVTNRDEWAKSLDAPEIKGLKRGNKLSIYISSNSDAGSRYDHEVFPNTSIHTVTVDEEGGITGITWRGERKELTQIQKNTLVEMFNGIKERATVNWERIKKTLSDTQFAS